MTSQPRQLAAASPPLAPPSPIAEPWLQIMQTDRDSLLIPPMTVAERGFTLDPVFDFSFFGNI
jgi:hypothetical protein